MIIRFGLFIIVIVKRKKNNKNKNNIVVATTSGLKVKPVVGVEEMNELTNQTTIYRTYEKNKRLKVNNKQHFFETFDRNVFLSVFQSNCRSFVQSVSLFHSMS